MVLRLLADVVLAPVRNALRQLGLVLAVFVIGLPIIGILAVLGMVMEGVGVPSAARQAIGLIVGLGLLAAVMGAFGYYLIDW